MQPNRSLHRVPVSPLPVQRMVHSAHVRRPFSSSLRSLEGPGVRRALMPTLVALALLGLWFAWFFFARTPIYLSSDAARIESMRKVHAVVAASSGPVLTTHLDLGR